MWVDAISARANVSTDALWRIANSASRRYFEFTIKKADGSDRLIEHPSRSLKALQRLISRNLVSKAPVHDAATAYSKGAKISENAVRHAGSDFTTRLDFANFFPSFDIESVRQFFREVSERNSVGLNDADLDFITKIVCRNGRLVIGAPSSPKITNAMMYNFDEAVSKLAASAGVIYTRYADDIYISAFEKDLLPDVERQIRDLVSGHRRPALLLKEKKTLYLSRAGHRSVTGLVLTPNGQVSIGRARKREIRTLLYLALNGKLTRGDTQRLVGLLAFAYDNEPDFVTSLSRKFGTDVVGWFKASA